MRLRTSRACVTPLVLIFAIDAFLCKGASGHSVKETFESVFGLSSHENVEQNTSNDFGRSALDNSELDDLIGKQDKTSYVEMTREEEVERVESGLGNKLSGVELRKNAAETERPKGLSPRIVVSDEANGKYVRYGKGNDVLLLRENEKSLYRLSPNWL